MKSTIHSLLFAALLGCIGPARLDAEQLYWSNSANPRVGHSNPDGTAPVTGTPTGAVFGMETVASTQFAYWIRADFANSTYDIIRSNADFTAIAPLISGLPGTISQATGPAFNLASDVAADLLFWPTLFDNRINFARLSDGSNLGFFAVPGQGPDEVTLDPTQQKLYWADAVGNVFRANYDGTSLETLIVGSGLGSGYIGMELDLAAGKIYLARTNSHRIERMNLDGTNLEIIVNLTERPFSMALLDGRMFWTDFDGGQLRSANTDGTDVVTLRTGLTRPRSLDIMLAVPEPAGIVLAMAGGVPLMIWRRRRGRRAKS